MSRLPHLTVCLLGVLLLMSFCWAEKEREDGFEEGYAITDDYDYNATFDYSFFSNSSIDELDKFLLAAGDTGDVEPSTDITPTEEVTEEAEEEQEEEQESVDEEVTITRPPTSRHIPRDEACRTTSPSLLITLGLISHHIIARLL